MLKKLNTVTAIFVASASLLASSGATFAASEKQCTVRTARQAASPLELCECTTVTRGMVNHIQRSRDFGAILAETSEACPPLAAILSDLPTAAIDDGDEPAGPNGPAAAPSSDEPAGPNGPAAAPSPDPDDDAGDNGCGGSCPGFD